MGKDFRHTEENYSNNYKRGKAIKDQQKQKLDAIDALNKKEEKKPRNDKRY